MWNRIIDSVMRRSLSPFAFERWVDLKGELKAMWVHRCGVRAASKVVWEKGASINVGCGSVNKPGYVRVDFCPGVDVRVDLRRPLPIPDGIADVILCEHFLEHLRYPGQARSFLKECHRILAPGGRMFLSVPDTRWPLESYVHGRSDYPEACKAHRWHPRNLDTYMEHINYHFRQQDDTRSDGHFECHRFAYDAETLAKVLGAAGFARCEERSFDRTYDSEHRRVGSLFMLGVK